MLEAEMNFSNVPVAIFQAEFSKMLEAEMNKIKRMGKCGQSHL